MSAIKYFTIYGERCSGTNFLEETIKANFGLQITWKYGWKHFFGFHNFGQPKDTASALYKQQLEVLTRHLGSTIKQASLTKSKLDETKKQFPEFDAADTIVKLNNVMDQLNISKKKMVDAKIQLETTGNIGPTEDNTLFIGIVRHPIEWLHSFYKQPHHVPNENKSMPNFLLKEFYSVDEAKGNSIIENDVNYVTKKRYSNIFEMRKMKNEYLMNIMPTKVKNYILINYEDLANNTDATLKDIQTKFGLEFTQKNVVKITYYQKNVNIKFVPKKVTFHENIIETIKKNIDVEQEKLLHYDLS